MPGEKLVVGVSGGNDSLALLHLLKDLSAQMGFSIHAATLDHQLRGRESAEDVNFVVRICEEWDIPVSKKKARVSALAERSQTSIEVAARIARYDFFAAVAGQVNASCVAVAHHADDQAETVLMHLLRGSGGKGLAGMALQSTLPGHPHIRLIRPLLYESRSMLEAYCRQHHLSPRNDSTNRDITILRNRIRHELLPYLDQYHSHLSQVLSQTAEISGVENDYLDGEVERICALGIATVSSERVSLHREMFRQLHPALQRRLVIWAMKRLRADDHLDYQHILNAVSTGMNGRQGAICEFSGGFRLRVDYGFVVIESKNVSSAQVSYPLLTSHQEVKLRIPGVINLKDWQLHISNQPFPSADPYPVCSLAIPEKSVLALRTRRAGDQFTPSGMEGHKQKINRLMINHKVPRPVRDHIPLLCVNDEIAAFRIAAAWIVSETFRIKNDFRRIIYVRFVDNS
jgi:tRNA(Ile)-lysidine synthetase-like protein